MQDGHSKDCYNSSGHLFRQLRIGGNYCTDAATLLVIRNCELVSFARSLQRCLGTTMPLQVCDHTVLHAVAHMRLNCQRFVLTSLVNKSSCYLEQCFII